MANPHRATVPGDAGTAPRPTGVLQRRARAREREEGTPNPRLVRDPVRLPAGRSPVVAAGRRPPGRSPVVAAGRRPPGRSPVVAAGRRPPGRGPRRAHPATAPGPRATGPVPLVPSALAAIAATMASARLGTGSASPTRAERVTAMAASAHAPQAGHSARWASTVS